MYVPSAHRWNPKIVQRRVAEPAETFGVLLKMCTVVKRFIYENKILLYHMRDDPIG